jgi:hypothetical protein
MKTLKRTNAIRDGTQQMKQWLLQLLHDKHGNPSMREIVILVSLVCLIISWIAQQFFNKPVPEFMYYAFVSMIGAGCFGYSLEKPQIKNNQE